MIDAMVGYFLTMVNTMVDAMVEEEEEEELRQSQIFSAKKIIYRYRLVPYCAPPPLLDRRLR